MAEVKTKPTNVNVYDFIEAFANTPQKKEDSIELVKLMQAATGYEPVMWGASIIGFGTYHYKSERSSQEGDWMMVGFSPRKAAISLYVHGGNPENEPIIAKLGKFKMGKGCIYVNKLSDIDKSVLKKLIQATVKQLKTKYKIK